MQQLLPIFPLPEALEISHLFSLSMDLPILNVLYKWNHTLVIYDLLCLTPSLVHIWGNRIKLVDFLSGEKIT